MVFLQDDQKESLIKINNRCLKRFKAWFINFHFKNRHRLCPDLVVFRVISIILLIFYSAMDSFMLGLNSTRKHDVLTFVHSSRYVGMEIAVVIYVSGVAAFGISVEIYILVPLAVLNMLLAWKNCYGSLLAINLVIWFVKTIILFLTTEVCHRNFRLLKGYNEHFVPASRTMLRQAILFSLTMLFASAPGLRAIYNGVNRNLPKLCPYEAKYCGIINFYEPLFSYEDDRCLSDVAAHASSREEIRVLRNYIIVNGVSYSIFNSNFLDIKHGTYSLAQRLLRVLILVLFVSIAPSTLISSIDPFIFIRRFQVVFNIVELVLFGVLIGCSIYNLYYHRSGIRQREYQLTLETESMDPSPNVLPSAEVFRS